jgi:hypothetical protein
VLDIASDPAHEARPRERQRAPTQSQFARADVAAGRAEQDPTTNDRCVTSTALADRARRARVDIAPVGERATARAVPPRVAVTTYRSRNWRAATFAPKGPLILLYR